MQAALKHLSNKLIKMLFHFCDFHITCSIIHADICMCVEAHMDASHFFHCLYRRRQHVDSSETRWILLPLHLLV